MDKLWEQRNRINIFAREQLDLVKKMQGCIWHLILQPACLGAKCMSLTDKWHSAIFQLRMLSDGWAMTNKLTKFMVNNCSDLGTEKSLAKPEFDCNSLCPWWCEAGVVDDVAGDVSTSPTSDAIVSMRSSLTTMGLEHICHNAEEHATRSLPSFKMWFVMASNLGKFLGSRFYKKQMEETIFSRHEAEWVRGEAAGFSDVPYEKRCGTLMAFNDSAHPLRKDLQRFWDETIWRGLNSRDNDEEEEWIDSSKVSEAILSNSFWSYMVMISALATGIEEIRRFWKSCPCHIETIGENGHLVSFRRRVLAFQKLSGSRNRCPAKGILVPWMALGKGREIV